MVFISNSSAPEERGKVNGLAQSIASFARMIGPYIGGSLFAWSEQNGKEKEMIGVETKQRRRKRKLLTIYATEKKRGRRRRPENKAYKKKANEGEESGSWLFFFVKRFKLLFFPRWPFNL